MTLCTELLITTTEHFWKEEIFLREKISIYFPFIYFIILHQVKTFQSQTRGELKKKCFCTKNKVVLTELLFDILTFWRRNYFFNFSTPCI